MPVPAIRIRSANDATHRPDGEFVVYMMTAFRRLNRNFALDRAVDLALEFNKPLLVFEPLRVGYRWASDRIHRFVVQGMADNAAHCRGTSVGYYPYLEREQGEAAGLLESLAKNACAVVTDDYPCFFLPQMIRVAGRKLGRQAVSLEAVDSNGLLPLAASDKIFARAFDFRRFLQKNLADHLLDVPNEYPLKAFHGPTFDSLPDKVRRRWPPVSEDEFSDIDRLLNDLPIDHNVRPATFDGGRRAGEAVLDEFIERRLAVYGDGRNHPDDDAASGLSPYLHFGHVSVHEVFRRVADAENWSPGKLGGKTGGARHGWWGMSETAESFLDELVTWRELGYNMTSKSSDYDRYESLPDWAQATLEEHESDEREHIYSLAEFEQAQTHDPIWNAAQTQLLKTGRMHNYLRMLWGKKVLHWATTPREALDILIELNNKYAVDGRDPNSYSGIFWIFGRYDRAWGPERPVFGKIRYMSSDSTRSKLKMTEYLRQFGEQAQRDLFA